MCGIVGFAQKEMIKKENLIEMTSTLSHRGPDDEGYFLEQDKECHIGLGHRRLKILDLSKKGHQPMFDNEKKVGVSYNGEIYNFAEIKKELQEKGHHFVSNSDTEVIVYAYKEWGISCVSKFNGMFAIAIYDFVTHKLFLVRDRLGIKPLYYYAHKEGIAFGSELKALLKYPKLEKKIDVEAMSYFFLFDYVPSPYCIFEGVKKLEPGSYLCFDQKNVSLHSFWSLQEQIKKKSKEQEEKSEQQVVDELEKLLLNSVKKRMIADVPLGAFLSGGVDSSLVVALMQKLSNKPVETFTIGFKDKFDEAPFAKKIAQHLKTNHHELYLSQKEILGNFSDIAHFFDEPFSDSSIIPTLALSKLTRNKVTVSLSGEGGDELFCGYNKYAQISRLQKFKLASNIYRIGALPFAKPIRRRLHQRFTQLFHMNKKNNVVLERALTSHSYAVDFLKNKPATIPKEMRDLIDLSDDAVLKSMYFDTRYYITENHLTKLDRASMSVALEGRVPLLDHRVVEYALATPLSTLFKNREKKVVLKRMLEKYVPKDLFEREKHGFGSPINVWLQKDLKPLVEKFLSPDYLKKQGLFDEKEVQVLRKQLSTRNDFFFGRLVWNILIFQIWYDKYMN